MIFMIQAQQSNQRVCSLYKAEQHRVEVVTKALRFGSLVLYLKSAVSTYCTLKVCIKCFSAHFLLTLIGQMSCDQQ